MPRVARIEPQRRPGRPDCPSAPFDPPSVISSTIPVGLAGRPEFLSRRPGLPGPSKRLLARLGRRVHNRLQPLPKEAGLTAGVS